MSRIGKAPVVVPSGVTATVEGGNITVKGPKGQLTQFIPTLVSVGVEGGEIIVTRDNDGRQARANHGLTRALIGNMVTGVTSGFEKRLEIQGVGYRAEVKGSNLMLLLGFSHPVEFPIPADVKIVAEKQTSIIISGIDKQRVGHVASVIRSFRSPDHYKGKGVRYVGETVRLKAGKSA